jgi:sugar phosphate isomerase/epimerase
VPNRISRRQALGGAAAAVISSTAAAATRTEAAPMPSQRRDPYTYCLNTATVMGQKLPITQLVDITAKAGYNAIEPWIRELDDYVKGGGSLKDLRKRIEDQGLSVISAIGFFDWIVDDPARRARGLEEAKRNLDLVAQIGGLRIAAPPAGATDVSNIHPMAAAERYRALLELGDQAGVVPQVEVWGFSKTVGRLGEAAVVAMEADHPKACVLADVYHLHKGGSAWEGLKFLRGARMPVFHMNDYPADPPRERIQDSHRVLPGQGVAPYGELFKTFRDIGFRGALSLELFNPDLWKQDALDVAKRGLKSMKDTVRKHA